MRGTRWRRLVIGAAVAVLGLGVATGGALAIDHAEATTSPAAASAAVLMKTFDANSGRIGGGWWTGAVSLSTIMTYRQATGDSQYDYAITDAFAKNSNFTNDYIDDTGWWSLVWLQAYDITGNTNYLNMAKTTTNYMHSYWDTVCGGGVYWSTAKQYKASIANELFLAAAAGLHNRIPGDTQYLGWADDEWKWFSGSGLISNNLVRDGLNVSGCTTNGAEFTYNQGVVLRGLTELSQATDNTGLLTTATSIATAATAKFNRNGVLYEGCEPNCTGDGQAFKGVFIRYLRNLATVTGSTAFDAFITTTADSILANDTNSDGQQGDSFVGPVAQWTYSTQTAALAALVAAVSKPAAPTQPATPKPTAPTPTGVTGVLRGSGSGRCVDVPGLRTANLTHVTLWDCNGGTNQKWTLTASKQLLVYGKKCLDADRAQTTNGTPVQIYTCDGGTNQQWTLNADGTIVGVGSGKCLDAKADATANSTPLQIFDCHGGANQKWTRA